MDTDLPAKNKVPNFWFKFEWDAWRNDPQLRRCSKETRGFWIDCIASMESQQTFFLEGTPVEICRDVVATKEEFDRSIAELARTGAATVEKCQGVVKIISRRLLKKLNLTEYNRLKQREHRERQMSINGQYPPSKDIDSKTLRALEVESSNNGVYNGGQAEAAAQMIDPVERRIWKDGLDLLTQNGTTEANARPLLGRLVKQYTKPLVAQAIAVTQAENPADPKAFLIGVLKERSGANNKAASSVGKYVPDEPIAITCGVCGEDYCLKEHREL